MMEPEAVRVEDWDPVCGVTKINSELYHSPLIELHHY